MSSQSNTDHEALEFHDEYIAAWNRATDRGTAEELRDFIADTYHGWTGTTGESLDPFDYDDAWNGFTQAAHELKGAHVEAKNRTIAWRGDREAVVFYELTYSLNNEVATRAALLEIWRKTEVGIWKLCRDVTEHSVSSLVHIA